MRCWKASRSQAFNEAVVTAILKWRRDVKLIEERHRRRIGYCVADYVSPVTGLLLQHHVRQECHPVFHALAELEDSFAAIGRG